MQLTSHISRGVLCVTALFIAVGLNAQSGSADKKNAPSLDDLLRQVERGKLLADEENRRREQRFMQNRNQQRKLLNDLKKERTNLERRSSKLESDLEKSSLQTQQVKRQLDEELGSLKELFGHLTSSAGDLRATFETSLISAQYPDREQFLTELINKTSNAEQLPQIEDLERLWFELQREMTESGKVSSFMRDVTHKNGDKKQVEVVRIGSFNAVSAEGKYLSYSHELLEELPRQPVGAFTRWAKNLAELDSGHAPFGVDPTGPTGGSFLSALIDSPTPIERWHQGGLIGYIITAVGVFAVLLAIWRVFYLMGVSSKVKRQLKSDEILSDNPLGRVMQVQEEAGAEDLETLELKISETVLKEVPKLESGQALLKIIAGVAPLMGLLGTVTGMILTFNGIVIFGAGDPKAMAGGISQALVTTVLGLLVAIPTVLLHTIVSGRSRQLIQILEEQSAGILAERTEQSDNPYQVRGVEGNA